MISYNIKLALHSFRRAPSLYFLVILTLAIGVGVLCANLALVSAMSSDPIPEKSDQLFHVSMNTWPNDEPQSEPFYILRYRDAMQIVAADAPKHSAVFYLSGVYSRDANAKDLTRYDTTVRATTPGFFALTNAPFAYGSGFQTSAGRDVVIGDELNQKIFAGINSVGKTLELDGELFTVIGVLKPWRLRPLFYHATDGNAFDATDDIYAPLETAIDLGWSVHARSSSAVSYKGIEFTRDRDVYYLQAWVELENPAKLQAFQQYLDNYSQALKDAGEHPLAIINELRDVNAWLLSLNIVDQKVLAFTLASVLFLFVCMFNASSLLLARFHGAKFEVGLRRAIGASNKHLLHQGLIESTLVGLITGIVGIVLSQLFLTLSTHYLPDLAAIAELEPKLLLLGMLLALFTSIASALYPLYRANRYSICAELTNN